MALQAYVRRFDLDPVLLFHRLGVHSTLKTMLRTESMLCHACRLSVKLMLCFRNGSPEWLLAADPGRRCGLELWGIHLLGSAIFIRESPFRNPHPDKLCRSTSSYACSACGRPPPFYEKEAFRSKREKGVGGQAQAVQVWRLIRRYAASGEVATYPAS